MHLNVHVHSIRYHVQPPLALVTEAAPAHTFTTLEGQERAVGGLNVAVDDAAAEQVAEGRQQLCEDAARL